MTAPVLVWFRNDLRLADHPALHAAAATGRPILPVFVLDDAAPGAWRPGGASRWWLHHSLASLAADLAARGLALVLRRGDAMAALMGLVGAVQPSAVLWNRRYEPWAVAQDVAIKRRLRAMGIPARSFNGALIREPWEVTGGSDRPYQRFSFFAGAWWELGPPPSPLPVPATLIPAGRPVPGLTLEELELLPRRPDWAEGLRQTWRPGEAGAHAALATFAAGPIQAYRTQRHRPGVAGATSRLSPHLRFGELSPRQAWHAAAAAGPPLARDRLPAFQRQLVWREFAYHLLFLRPDMPEAPLRRDLAPVPWAVDEAGFKAWTRGRTGYPLVDAGMRELWRSGTMHNRARMVTASFLTKHLLLPWQKGEAWFWDTLCDADLANNAMGWQWVAGCGADSAGYPKVFNPVANGRRFDPDGAYVRRWVPELARLPDAFIHRPHQAPRQVLTYAGVELGRTYPWPLVEHDAARERARAAHGR